MEFATMFFFLLKRPFSNELLFFIIVSIGLVCYKTFTETDSKCSIPSGLSNRTTVSIDEVKSCMMFDYDWGIPERKLVKVTFES